MTLPNPLLKSLIIVLAAVFLTACDSGPLNNSDSPNILATLNHKTNIKTQSLSTADQIKLFNLKYQLHELTLSATRENIEKNHPVEDAITWLTPKPSAPTVNIPIGPSWAVSKQHPKDSKQTKPLSIDVACTYASRPCTELINQLEEWRPMIQRGYTIRYFDLPQSYHRLGVESAAVVSCLDGEAKENMKTFLWQRQGQMDMAALTGAIDLYSPNPSETYQCMSSNETLENVQTNIQALKELGLNLTPTVIINNEYISRGYEQRELFTQLFASLEFSPMEGTPEVKWVQSWVTPEQKQSWALVEYQGQILRVTPGVNLGQYWIAGIAENGLTLVKNNQITSLPFAPVATSIARASNQDSSHTTNLYDPANRSQQPDEDDASNSNETFTPQSHKERYDHVISQLKAVPLPQDWLEEQLMRQQELEESLHLTDSQIEGKSLVKLNKNEVDDFYTSLGMKPGDVIVRVNDEWVHEESNTLFQSLANEDKVTISIMRKGLPVHLAFETQ